MSQARHWAFTLNNPCFYPSDMEAELQAFGYDYAVFQLEVGERDTPHYQGYVIFTSKQRLTAIRHLFDTKANWQIARKGPGPNRAYCTKEPRIGDFCELGNIPDEAGQGARSDLVELHSRLKDGLSLPDYSNEFFTIFVKHPDLVARYSAAQSRPRSQSQATRCILYFGPSRTGKSRLSAFHAGQHTYRKFPGKWWDGYTGEPSVIFEDFRGSSLSFTDFKLTVDRYPLRVELKGTTRELEATNFFITSNFPPSAWWDDSVTGNSLDTIENRITEVFWMPKQGLIKYFSTFREFSWIALAPHPEDFPPPVFDTLTFDQDGTPSYLLPQAQVY